MIIIPGFLIDILTFPGIIVHEAAHLLFCKLGGVAVKEVCYFRIGNPAGYVVHEEIEDFTSAFFVSVGPFIINSLVCIAVCVPAHYLMRITGGHFKLSLFMMWLGLSVGKHAFPSSGDAAHLFYYTKKEARSGNRLAWLGFPLVTLIYIVNLLSFFWADLAYSIVLGIGLPLLFF